MDKIICAGKNYLDHAIEMKDAIPEKPVLFLKPPSTVVSCSAWSKSYDLHLPKNIAPGDIHYECELVFLISKDGYCFSPQEAKAALSHVTIGLDLTNRPLQQKAKETGGPWEVGKVFPEATVIGPWLSYDNENELSFSYSVNNEVRQQSSSASMRLNPIELLVYASQYFPICKGDVLFTGTPAGVDSIMLGDRGKLQLQNYEYTVQW